jgi:hypothetical protein
MLRLATAAVLLISLASSFAAGKEPLEVKIAIPVHHGHRSLNEADHFHVLVRNVSDAPVKLWTDRFSWGYDNLSFDLTDDDAKHLTATKQPRGWSKNYPDWLELQPGEEYVLNVNLFAGETWQNVPARPKGTGPKLVKMRAVYEIKPDDESKRLGVWTGRIQSLEGTYAIW